mmetsp:Transcript_83563/g.235731  ORF Transcript_83563/g.235731 Transcript_83563/m.235731 type:complete len:270 (+) Transcript_83563:1432-2241(+)
MRRRAGCGRRRERRRERKGARSGPRGARCAGYTRSGLSSASWSTSWTSCTTRMRWSSRRRRHRRLSSRRTKRRRGSKSRAVSHSARRMAPMGRRKRERVRARARKRLRRKRSKTRRLKGCGEHLWRTHSSRLARRSPAEARAPRRSQRHRRMRASSRRGTGLSSGNRSRTACSRSTGVQPRMSWPTYVTGYRTCGRYRTMRRCKRGWSGSTTRRPALGWHTATLSTRRWHRSFAGGSNGKRRRWRARKKCWRCGRSSGHERGTLPSSGD